MQPVAGSTRFQPFGIAPGVAIEIADDRGGVGAKFGGERVRIRFERETVFHAGDDLEFVQRALGEFGNKKFPDAAFATGAHRIYATVPGIEIAHHADPASVGGPNGEMHSSDSGYFTEVGTQLLIFLVVRSFAGKIEIEIGEDRRKGVWIEHFQFASSGEAEMRAAGRVGN